MKTQLFRAIQAATFIAVEGQEVGDVGYPSVGLVKLETLDREHCYEFSDRQIEVDDEGRCTIIEGEDQFDLRFEVTEPLSERHLKGVR